MTFVVRTKAITKAQAQAQVQIRIHLVFLIFIVSQIYYQGLKDLEL